MLRGLVALLLAAAACLAGTARAQPVSGWLTFANDPLRTGHVEQGIDNPGTLHEVWSQRVDGSVTTQVLVARDVPEPGEQTIYLGTSEGVLIALDQNGLARTSRQLGFMRLGSCPFLPGGKFGITGTPAIDGETSTIYVTDALGYAHALDVVTLEEREGWPVRLYRDPSMRLTWGAVTLAKGKLFVGTGELCRRDVSTGRLFSVDLATREVKTWVPTPRALGGGSGIWGWGGPAYDAKTDSILVATSGAYPIGRNRGKRFSESAGRGLHMVRLTSDLEITAENTPLVVRKPRDLGFSGTPIVMRAKGCPDLVAGENKNGVIYVWRLDAIGKGIVSRLRLAGNLNGQPAWSPRARALYVGGNDKLYKLSLTRGCELRKLWEIPLGVNSVNGPPTVAGDVVWFPVAEKHEIWAINARTGAVLWRGTVGESVFTAPTLLDGRVYAAGFSGRVKAFGR